MLAFSPMSAKGQAAHTTADSACWEEMSVSPGQLPDDVRMPKAYFYTTPEDFRIEIYNIEGQDDLLQLTNLKENAFFEDSICAGTWITYETYCNMPLTVYSKNGEVVKKSNLALIVNGRNIHQLISTTEYNPVAKYVMDYLLNKEGYITLKIPFLDAKNVVIKIPCVEGKARIIKKN